MFYYSLALQHHDPRNTLALVMVNARPYLQATLFGFVDVALKNVYNLVDQRSPFGERLQLPRSIDGIQGFSNVNHHDSPVKFIETYLTKLVVFKSTAILSKFFP